MKRFPWEYVFLSVILVLMAALAVYGFFFKRDASVGAVATVFVCCTLFALFTAIARTRLNAVCVRLFREKKFEEERALLEKKRNGLFSFFTRIPAMPHYVITCMALDDLPAAARIIDRLRHGGGAGWRYNTAYCYILIKLDEGDLQSARREFEDFRLHCAHAEIYQGQLEVLTAIFSRLLSARDTEPLPEKAVNSNFPVVGRILGRAQEALIAEREEEWN